MTMENTVAEMAKTLDGKISRYGYTATSADADFKKFHLTVYINDLDLVFKDVELVYAHQPGGVPMRYKANGDGTWTVDDGNYGELGKVKYSREEVIRDLNSADHVELETSGRALKRVQALQYALGLQDLSRYGVMETKVIWGEWRR